MTSVATAMTAQQYQASFPVIGDQTVTIAHSLSAPARILVGTTVVVTWDVAITLGPDTVEQLRAAGAETLEGRMVLGGSLALPGFGTLPITLRFEIPATALPADGSVLPPIAATATLPPMAFPTPGLATWSAETADFTLTATPGELGTFAAPAKVAAGQAALLREAVVLGK